MANNNELEKIKSKIIRVLKEKGIKKAGIFGSYARGEQTKKSDVDILIDPPKEMGIEFYGLMVELEDELGRKVDLLSYNGINPNFKKYILGEEVRII